MSNGCSASMCRGWALSLAVATLGFGSAAQANEVATPILTLDAVAATTAAPATTAPHEEIPRLVNYVDYGGDLWQRPALTGDWGGTRQKLMEKGVRLDLNYYQVIQRNVAGGTSQACTYRGGTNIGLQLDTTYMGLWPGGWFVIRGEGGWGQGDNGRTGTLVPVDNNGLYPAFGKDAFLLVECNYTQFLAPFLGVTVGKYEPRDSNVFAHDETEQFLNSGFNFNPVIATTLPTCFLGAGIILLPTPWLMSVTMALDTEGTAEESGFDTVFERGTSFMESLEATVKPFDLTGHQRVCFLYSDKVRTQFGQTSRDIIGSIIRGNTSRLATASNDWCFTYDFDQYVYMLPGSKDRGVGVFGRFGFDNGVVNPVQTFYSIGVSGKGLIPGRGRDTCGLGYFYAALSDNLGQVIQNKTRNEQGVEMYYNIAVTPWLKVTPDLQILSPANESVDTTVVLGMRMKIDF